MFRDYLMPARCATRCSCSARTTCMLSRAPASLLGSTLACVSHDAPCSALQCSTLLLRELAELLLACMAATWLLQLQE